MRDVTLFLFVFLIAVLDKETMEQLKDYSNALEDALETIASPLKPIIPVFARFLLVVTFLEDAMRIIVQWSEQNNYLHYHRDMPWGITHIFLALNVLVLHLFLVLI
jgi:hypothetical protein